MGFFKGMGDRNSMRIKLAIFAMIVALVPSMLLAGAAEFAVRWRTNGSFKAAWQSFAPQTKESVSWLAPDADLGYKLNPAGEAVNSLGIRHAEIGPRSKGDAERVIVIGDSVAYDDDGFVALLRKQLGEQKLEVINASIPGYTTFQERTLLERDLLALDPKLVLLQYCMNDNHRFLHRLEPGGNWIIIPEAIGGGEQKSLLPGWLQASYIVKRVQWRLEANSRSESEETDPFPWRDTPEFGAAWLDESWEQQEVQIRAIRDATLKRRTRFAIVVFPLESQLARRALSQDEAYTLKPQRHLVQIGKRLGVPVLDLHPAFAALGDAAGEDGLFRDGLHLTAAGHDLATREILAFLDRESLLSTH